MELFSTIVADPPWPIRNGPQWGTTGASTPLPYPVLSIDAIKALGVRHWAAPDSHLYLWTINKYVTEAYDVARAWGFTPSTLLVWTKPVTGGGLGGTYKITTEFCLFARRGSLAALDWVPSTHFDWPRQRPHSKKPESFLDMVERVSPGPYLEIFARRARIGWEYAGNQSLGTVEIDGLDAPGSTGTAPVDRSHDRSECPRCLTEHGSDDCP